MTPSTSNILTVARRNHPRKAQLIRELSGINFHVVIIHNKNLQFALSPPTTYNNACTIDECNKLHTSMLKMSIVPIAFTMLMSCLKKSAANNNAQYALVKLNNCIQLRAGRKRYLAMDKALKIIKSTDHNNLPIVIDPIEDTRLI